MSMSYEDIEMELNEELGYKLSEFCRNFGLTGQRKHDALIALCAIISGHADNFRGD